MRSKHWVLAVAAASLVACSGDTGGDSGGPDRNGSGCDPGFVEVRGTCVPDETDTGTGDAGTDTPAMDTTPTDTTPTDTGGPDTPTDTGGEPDASCIDGATRCSMVGIPQTCRSGVFIDEMACGGGQVCAGGRCVAGADCTPGEVIGCASDTEQRVCNAAGDNFESVTCTDPGPFCFRGECGTQVCEPGNRRCAEDDLTIELCNGTGESWTVGETCDRREDLVCALGECVSGCIAAIKFPTYVGCEYWSVDLPQYEDPGADPRVVPHAVVVANTGDRPAEVTISTMSGIPLVTENVTVEAGAVETLNFPRADVENTARSMRSFRIDTTEPVVAYQFNPLNNANVFSNDASLLLPANAIGREYYVMSWPSGIGFLGFPPQTGWFTVVAPAEGVTQVTITFSAKLIDGTELDLQGITAGSTHVFNMRQGEVLNFEAESSIGSIGDLTGTHVMADRPVIVFGGHEEAVIGEGEDTCCADHMEQQLFPVSTWGTRYFAVHSPPRGTEVDYWRVLASRNGTRITTTPAILGLDGTTLNAGEFVEVSTAESFEINATAPVMVGQFIVSQQADGVTNTQGDPAFVLAVPVEQYRFDYAVLTPSGYQDDYITVIRPVGAAVNLDGNPMNDGDFTAFGTLEYEYATIPVEPGPHNLDSPTETPFATAMWGYDSAVSYGYPGGLDLGREDPDGPEEP